MMLLIEQRQLLKREISINKNYRMTMLNVNIGSDTRLMVSKVLKTINNDFNSSLEFKQLNQHYSCLLSILTTEGEPKIAQLRELGSKVRKVLMTISQQTQVPILPPSINELLEEVLDEIPEAGYCSVPGAGGFDAVLLVGKDREDRTFEEIIGQFSTQSKSQVSVLPISV